MSSTITIDPLTRIEGHGRVEILLDDLGEVVSAYLVVPDLRGFERFCVGRPAEEMPRLTARICGLCPHAHHIASVKALDDLFGCPPPSTARKIRELFYNAYFFLDHTTHFFLLAGPDWLLDVEATGDRDFLALAQELGPDTARRIVGIRARNNRLIEAMGGRSIHAVAALPGGWSCRISEETRQEAEATALENRELALASLEIFRQRVLDRPALAERLLESDSCESLHSMGTVDEQNRPRFYDGQIRVVDPCGGELVRYQPRDYLEHVAERVEPWTYLKVPYLHSLGWKGLVGGADSGVYAATPLARLNVADAMATPRANDEYETMQATLSQSRREGRFAPLQNPLLNHWARLIEMLQAAETMLELARDSAICGPEIRNCHVGTPVEGVGSLEAPRGTLTHHYRTDSEGIITGANLLVGTTNNHAAIAMTITREARRWIGHGQASEPEALREIEVAIRAYDPCLSCATHALPGSMGLELVVRNPSGTVVRRIATPI